MFLALQGHLPCLVVFCIIRGKGSVNIVVEDDLARREGAEIVAGSTTTQPFVFVLVVGFLLPVEGK